MPHHSSSKSEYPLEAHRRHCNGTGPHTESIPELSDGCPDVKRHVIIKVIIRLGMGYKTDVKVLGSNTKEGPYEVHVRSLEELSEWAAKKWDSSGSGTCQLMTAANFPLTEERFSKPTSSRVPLVVHVRRLSAEAEKSELIQKQLMANNDNLLAELASVKSFNEKLLRRVSELELVLFEKQTVTEHEGPMRPFGGLQSGESLIIGCLRALRSIRDRPVLALMTVLAIISLIIVAVMAGHIAASRTIAAHRGDTQKLIIQEAATIESRLLENSTREVLAWREETRQDLHNYFEHLLNVTEMGFAYLKTDIDNRFKELSTTSSSTNSSATNTSKIVHEELQRDLRFPTSQKTKTRPALRTKALAGSPEDQLLKDISP